MRPGSEAELADMIKNADRPMRIRGGGTRPVGQSSGEVLDLSGLTGITLYEPGALTIAARAGTPLAEIEAALNAENQRLSFEPADWRGLLGTDGTSTIGGVVAGNISGPRRIQAGACRDSLIGVRFVDGTGTLIKNGGRVMKNVTGYDLVKLMAGSWGTLGVLTEVSFKILPQPAAMACLTVAIKDVETAVKVMSAALTSPYDVTGAAYLPGDGALIRVEGFADSVAYRVDQLTTLLGEFGVVTVDDTADAVAQKWQHIRDVAPFHGREGDVWRISVKPSDAAEVARKLGGEHLFDWGGGLIWARVPQGTDARTKLAGIAGHTTLIRASEGTRTTIPAFPPEPGPLAEISAGLRARFDPKEMLNPGLMATTEPA